MNKALSIIALCLALIALTGVSLLLFLHKIETSSGNRLTVTNETKEEISSFELNLGDQVISVDTIPSGSSLSFHRFIDHDFSWRVSWVWADGTELSESYGYGTGGMNLIDEIKILEGREIEFNSENGVIGTLY